MFERYTDCARRTVFFARYEAGKLGSDYIETEHLLLGALREDGAFRNRLPDGAADQIRKRIEERAPESAPHKTSVDLPLSADAKKALNYAAQEHEALHHTHIDTWHLILGVLQIENSMAAALLREFGIEYASFRATPPDLTRPKPLT